METKNYRNPCKHVEADERIGTTRKNACGREAMVKIRLAMAFATAQAALIKHASRRSMNIVVEDRAIQHTRNMVTICLSNTELTRERASLSVDR